MMMASRSSSSSSSAPEKKCRSPAGLERCSCCLDLANRRRLDWSPRRGNNNNSEDSSDESPAGSPCLCPENLHADGRTTMGRFLRQPDALLLEPTVGGPGGSGSGSLGPPQGLRDHAVDQTLLSILLFFHSASGASVVAIDNKIEQAMDLVKNHLMYAVREEVEVLKEQIKELAEKNSQLEWENSLLKNLASPEQLQKFQSRLPVEDEPPSPVATTAPEKPQRGPRGAAAPAQHPLGSAV